jgi:CRISPR-associated endoribonuclease Cas6
MQLTMIHHLEKELRLPLSYHHIVQSAIYHCLGQEKNYSTFLHDRGYEAEKRNYKMFTFGLLRGKYTIEHKQIVFRDTVILEVRSAEARFIDRLASYVRRNGITYLGKTYRNLTVQVSDDTVEGTELVARMRSPICVYSTDGEQKKTYYYSPEDVGFADMVNQSFIRKYHAYYGVEPDSGIYIEPLRVTKRDESVTRYKGFYITAWSGTYLLAGKRKYLDFLYQTGLGSKTSQGFGMFDVEAYRK